MPEGLLGVSADSSRPEAAAVHWAEVGDTLGQYEGQGRLLLGVVVDYMVASGSRMDLGACERAVGV